MFLFIFDRVDRVEKNISTTEKNLIQLLHDLEAEKSIGIQNKLSSLSPFEIARLLEAMEPRNRNILWRMVEKEDEGEVLKELVEDVRQTLIDQMDTNEIIAATQDLELDDLADILNDLPDQITDEVIRALDRQDQIRLESVMSYDEDSAGGLTNPNILSIRRGLNIKSLIRYLRSLEKLPENTNYIYVINRNNEYIGSVRLVDLFTEDTEIPIEQIMDSQVGPISASSSAEQVISTFQNLDLISLPVVDDENKLLGEITVDDVVDAIQDQANSEIFNMAGLDDEDDIFAPIFVSSRRRAVWLGANLLTAFVVASAVSLFQSTIDQIVILAVLMPIVASMGGVAGNQTLILVIRGIAMGRIQASNAVRLLSKEMMVALVNGTFWAIIVSVFAVLLFQTTWEIGIIVGISMLLNIFASAIAGVTIPFLLKKIGIDPALASGVMMTTLTDVLGFVTFLGLATLILL
ncbi:MAG: magnesium transporter [Gammaproteobacteria bacterium]|nr:magnesium transporter [Gammaproteobacteria bacterium]OUT93137.1 MAG: magnesium transporter [Gammaproteobacteria bacterium TMED36]